MERTKYDETQHQRAFELWYDKGLSYSDIAERPDMPSYATVKRWAKGEVDCDCGYHDWRQKRSQIVSEAREDVKEELDLPDRTERERNQLRFIYRTRKRLQELIEESDFEDLEQMEDLDSLETAVKLLRELSDEQRLILGEATEITEERGSQGSTLTLQKVAKQLNLITGNDELTEDDLIRAAEEQIMEGGNNGDR